MCLGVFGTPGPCVLVLCLLIHSLFYVCHGQLHIVIFWTFQSYQTLLQEYVLTCCRECIYYLPSECIRIQNYSRYLVLSVQMLLKTIPQRFSDLHVRPNFRPLYIAQHMMLKVESWTLLSVANTNKMHKLLIS